MNLGINTILERYDPKSYDLRGRVRVIWYFFLIIIPVLLAFVTIMNVLIPRGLFQALNVIVTAIIIILPGSMALIARGYYNIAASIMAFGVLFSLMFNIRGTEASGSAQRFIASEFALIMPIFFSLLFCRKWVLVAVSVLVEATILYTIITSPIVDQAVRYVVTVSMSITVIISFIIAMMMTTITETAKRLRARDAERQHREQKEINEKLTESMRSVSTRLDDSSRDLSGDVMHFAENIQGQAASIEEITATMEQISSGAEQVSTSAQGQSELMDALMRRMDDLVTMIREMETRIASTLKRTDAIAATARSGESYIGHMDASMNEIGATSREMTGILAIINDISDRINLLSLNASIEAARAGDYGRGFAVVADEISKLADQTSSSVSDIATLIAKSETEVGKGTAAVQDTVKIMREILVGVEESNRLMETVKSAMDTSIESTGEAHGAVVKVKERSEEINTASAEQKTAAVEVMNTITSINELSQTNAVRADDITGHSRDIASMAGDLREKIASIKDDTSYMAPL